VPKEGKINEKNRREKGKIFSERHIALRKNLKLCQEFILGKMKNTISTQRVMIGWARSGSDI
jgi:hypothetical protein